MKILVLGASGMAGHTIAIYLKERGFDVVTYTRTPFMYCQNIVGDVLDLDKFKRQLVDGDYDVVINCIGILNQDAENNPSKAVYLNGFLPHLIADTLKFQKTKLIHMSTDCVFQGNGAPYFESSFCDGRTFYDRTKAIGEVNDNKNLTFRNSIIGPDMYIHGIGLFNWFMKQKLHVKGYTGAIWTGVTTLTLAKAMEKAIEENLTGLYNLVNNSSISKYDLLLLFNKYFMHGSFEVEMDGQLKLDKSLHNTRNDFSFIVPSYEQMIIEMKEWVDDHKNLYKHYFN